MNNIFEFRANPQLIFGAGTFSRLPDLIAEIAGVVLLVRGGNSLIASGHWDWLLDELEKREITALEFVVDSEPSPELVDEAAALFRKKQIHAVAAIGGGSVLDAGKAISAMLPQKESVTEFLEGIGKKSYNGFKAPFIAVPTTAGTGSEATKNAVLSHIGKNGYKKSLRHDNLIPDIALVDPELTLTCPEGVTIACGLDAFSQLLESYVSTGASFMTDVLALEGIRQFSANFNRVLDQPDNLTARAGLSASAYLSGATLANAGLGIVHSLAGILGGMTDIPHGVACGTLIAAGHKANIQAMRKNPDKYAEPLRKYAVVGRVMALDNGQSCLLADEVSDFLVQTLESWVAKWDLPRLSCFGITSSDGEKITRSVSLKSNPVSLTPEEIHRILIERI